jgi:hypothetical protein
MTSEKDVLDGTGIPVASAGNITPAQLVDLDCG